MVCRYVLTATDSRSDSHFLLPPHPPAQRSELRDPQSSLPSPYVLGLQRQLLSEINNVSSIFTSATTFY